MTERELIATMASHMVGRPFGPRDPSPMSPEDAVKRARKILSEVDATTQKPQVTEGPER